MFHFIGWLILGALIGWIASKIMHGKGGLLRNIIVDFARRRSAERRGGRLPHVTLDTGIAGSVSDEDADVERLDDALTELERSDPRLKRVVEMRYFGGMSDAEIAEALGVTPRTVGRDWARARMLLSVALRR